MILMILTLSLASLLMLTACNVQPADSADDSVVESQPAENVQDDVQEKIEEESETEEVQDAEDTLEIGDIADRDDTETMEKVDSVHKVEITESGFAPSSLTINIGDTVEWRVARTGSYKKAMIVGARNCLDVRSQPFTAGEFFSWTFTEPETCTIVDGVMTTLSSKIVIK